MSFFIQSVSRFFLPATSTSGYAATRLPSQTHTTPGTSPLKTSSTTGLLPRNLQDILTFNLEMTPDEWEAPVTLTLNNVHFYFGERVSSSAEKISDLLGKTYRYSDFLQDPDFVLRHLFRLRFTHHVKTAHWLNPPPGKENRLFKDLSFMQLPIIRSLPNYISLLEIFFLKPEFLKKNIRFVIYTILFIRDSSFQEMDALSGEPITFQTASQIRLCHLLKALPIELLKDKVIKDILLENPRIKDLLVKNRFACGLALFYICPEIPFDEPQLEGLFQFCSRDRDIYASFLRDYLNNPFIKSRLNPKALQKIEEIFPEFSSLIANG